MVRALHALLSQLFSFYESTKGLSSFSINMFQHSLSMSIFFILKFHTRKLDVLSSLPLLGSTNLDIDAIWVVKAHKKSKENEIFSQIPQSPKIDQIHHKCWQTVLGRGPKIEAHAN